MKNSKDLKKEKKALFNRIANYQSSEDIKKEINVQIKLVGLTSITLIGFTIFISLVEHLGFLYFYLGKELNSFTAMDTWLILWILIFGFPIYSIFYLLHLFDKLEV